jgi:hypothetical protein
MVSTTSISSLGALRPFIERAFRRPSPVAEDSRRPPASCSAPLPKPDEPSHEHVAIAGS